jgi:cell division protein FtsN
MARDYKHAGKKKTKRKPVSGPVWMVAGLSVGLLVALLVYLSGQPGGLPLRKHTVSIATPTHKTAHRTAAKSAHKSESKKPVDNAEGADGVRYEFYTLLPQSEVVIPDDELAGHAKGSKAPPAKTGSYMLQAGSFRHEPEAKKLKAELALLGIVAGIQSVTVGGDTWYRVRIGPFSSFEDINRVRRRLQTNHINAIAVRIKG